MKKITNKYLQKNDGFTIVELMIVVSIIGILASVSSVFFNYYRSKSKSTEAKLALSSAYTSQQIFYNAFDMYSNCLSDMGFEITGNNRHYAIGFPNITANIDVNTHNMALANGLPVGTCSATLAPTLNVTYFLATSGVGNAVVGTQGAFAAAITLSSNDMDEVGGPNVSDVQEGLGDQSVVNKKLFVIPAFGYINTEFVSPANGSLWTVDSNKLIKQHSRGF